MLILFALANYKSFKDRAELSLLPKPSDKTIRGALIDVRLPGLKAKALLPAAAIYGANASGKTNFLLGLRAFRESISFSQASWTPRSRIPVDPYLGSSEPTHFEADFVVKGTRYKYGFKANREVFLEEYLFSYPYGRERALFKRTTKDLGESYVLTLEVGPSLKGPKRDHDATLRRTRHNSLFLSAAAQDNQEQCLEIYTWFTRGVIDHTRFDDRGFGKSLTSVLATDFPDFRGLLLPIMRMADPCITDVVLTETDPDDASEAEKTRTIDRGNRVKVAFQVAHSEDKYEIPHEKESRGTKRLYSFAGQLITALKFGNTLIVDELETSMHAHIASQLLALFQNKASNPNGAQLIFTTHETRLLNLQHLRRDQIWFCERDGLESSLYSLLEFTPRKDENFEIGYLRGRYGAVPTTALDPSWIAAINSSSESEMMSRFDG